MNEKNWLTEYSENGDLWVPVEEMQIFPSMICYAYERLRQLAKEGDIYGILLKCKDMVEVLLKVPVLMALIVLEEKGETEEASAGFYQEVMNELLKNPLSVGSWEALGRKLSGRKNTVSEYPPILQELLKQIYSRLFKTPVDRYPNIINWRNQEIAHGLLRHKEDEAYRKETLVVLNMLRSFFREPVIREMFRKVRFQAGNDGLVGDAGGLSGGEGEVRLLVEDREYPVCDYVCRLGSGLFWFDSFYGNRNKLQRTPYFDRRSVDTASPVFTEKYRKYVKSRDMGQSVDKAVLTEDEEGLLEELMARADQYEVPELLVQRVDAELTEMKKGCLMVCMERGTGKTAFANQMRELFGEDNPYDLPPAMVYCYHVANLARRGIKDFTDTMNHLFRGRIVTGTEEFPVLFPPEKEGGAAGELAHFLNRWNRIYEDKYETERTILVIDGLDELKPEDEGFLKLLPDSAELEKGVFLLILSRFPEEQTVSLPAKKMIQKMRERTERRLEIRRTSPENLRVLESYVKRFYGGIPAEEADRIIREEADHRMLYLRGILLIRDKASLDISAEQHFLRSYLNYLLSRYSGRSRDILTELLATLAVMPGFTLEEYCGRLHCRELTYEFMGVLSDILPLLTVERGEAGSTYGFANITYGEYLLREYREYDFGADLERNVREFSAGLREEWEGFLAQETEEEKEGRNRERAEYEIHHEDDERYVKLTAFAERAVHLLQLTLNDAVDYPAVEEAYETAAELLCHMADPAAGRASYFAEISDKLFRAVLGFLGKSPKRYPSFTERYRDWNRDELVQIHGLLWTYGEFTSLISDYDWSSLERLLLDMNREGAEKKKAVPQEMLRAAKREFRRRYAEREEDSTIFWLERLGFSREEAEELRVLRREHRRENPAGENEDYRRTEAQLYDDNCTSFPQLEDALTELPEGSEESEAVFTAFLRRWNRAYEDGSLTDFVDMVGSAGFLAPEDTVYGILNYLAERKRDPKLAFRAMDMLEQAILTEWKKRAGETGAPEERTELESRLYYSVRLLHILIGDTAAVKLDQGYGDHGVDMFFYLLEEEQQQADRDLLAEFIRGLERFLYTPVSQLPMSFAGVDRILPEDSDHGELSNLYANGNAFFGGRYLRFSVEKGGPGFIPVKASEQLIRAYTLNGEKEKAGRLTEDLLLATTDWLEELEGTGFFREAGGFDRKGFFLSRMLTESMKHLFSLGQVLYGARKDGKKDSLKEISTSLDGRDDSLKETFARLDGIRDRILAPRGLQEIREEMEHLSVRTDFYHMKALIGQYLSEGISFHEIIYGVRCSRAYRGAETGVPPVAGLKRELTLQEKEQLEVRKEQVLGLFRLPEAYPSQIRESVKELLAYVRAFHTSISPENIVK